MMKKRNPLDNPPAASSSDDDDDASSSEEEDQPKPQPKPQPQPPSSSDSDSGSETETDSESETKQQPPLNRASGKAILAAAQSQPPPAISGTKRTSEGTSKEDGNEEKKKKTGEDAKKPAAFQRLWTEEDEIAVLQGMIDFKKDTCNSPYDDTNAYYDYIKQSISFEVSKNQFMDKLRSLKKKYMGKEKPSFTKPHDHKSYTLCKYIWGPDGMALESNGVSKKKTKKPDSVKQENGEETSNKYDWFEKSFLGGAIAGFGVDEHYVKQRWSLVPVETKKKVEEKFKMLQAKEFEFVLHKTEILHEIASMIAEAYKN